MTIRPPPEQHRILKPDERVELLESMKRAERELGVRYVQAAAYMIPGATAGVACEPGGIADGSQVPDTCVYVSYVLPLKHYRGGDGAFVDREIAQQLNTTLRSGHHQIVAKPLHNWSRYPGVLFGDLCWGEQILRNRRLEVAALSYGLRGHDNLRDQIMVLKGQNEDWTVRYPSTSGTTSEQEKARYAEDVRLLHVLDEATATVPCVAANFKDICALVAERFLNPTTDAATERPADNVRKIHAHLDHLYEEMLLFAVNHPGVKGVAAEDVRQSVVFTDTPECQPIRSMHQQVRILIDQRMAETHAPGLR